MLLNALVQCGAIVKGCLWLAWGCRSSQLKMSCSY